MSSVGSDGVSEITYWQSTMDEAYAFVERCLLEPVEENGEGLVSLEESALDSGVEIAFSARPHAGGRPRIFVLRESLVEPFVNAAADFNRRGWLMKVDDGYRSLEMQRALATDPSILDAILRSVLAETGGQAPDPELMFRRVSTLVATRPRAATHMSGSAIDISVFDRSTDVEIDRGGPYLEMSARTPMASPFVLESQAEARHEITAIMANHGFFAYPFEFWHYSAGDVLATCIAGRGRARFGPVAYDPASKQCTPLSPDEFVVTPAELEIAIERMLVSPGAV